MTRFVDLGLSYDPKNHDPAGVPVSCLTCVANSPEVGQYSWIDNGYAINTAEPEPLYGRILITDDHGKAISEEFITIEGLPLRSRASS